jgi:thioesterase domain-containing protein/acyl carrier protein
VLFDAGLATLLGHFEEGREPFLLEVGPGRTLTNLARRHRLAERGLDFQPSMRRPRQMGCDRERVLTALGALWTAGVEIDWAGHHGGARRRRVPLPTYPFERRSYWVGRDRPEEGEPREERAPSPAPELAGVQGEVAVAFRELLGVEPAAEDDFFDLGGSSLMAVQLGARLREISGVELPSDFLLQASTPAALAALVESRRAAAESGEAPVSSSLVPLRKSGSRTPLFLVHQVGGNVYSYRALTKELPAAQPIYALRSPGLEPGEETLGSVEEMAERYLELVRETQPRGPYRIGGASMGGMIAFEMAHRLTDAGEVVELLTLMDSPCGDQMPPKPETDYDITAGVYMGPGRLAPDEVEGMDAEEQLRYAVEKARREGPGSDLDRGADFDRELDQLRRLAAVLRANIEALFSYQPEPWDGRATFFRAGEKRPGEPPRPERPWIELARGGIEIHVVPGNHTTMHEPPNVETLARHLERSMGALRALTDRRQ